MQIALLVADLFALGAAIRTLVAALKAHPDDEAASRKHYAYRGYLAAVMVLSMASVFMLGDALRPYPPIVGMIAQNVALSAFIWTVAATFSLVVTVAGLMKEALQVMARAGVVILILAQWPLWQALYLNPAGMVSAFSAYQPAGLVFALFLLAYTGLAGILLWTHRASFTSPVYGPVLTLLLVMQAVVLAFPSPAIVGLAAVVAAFSGAVAISVALPEQGKVSPYAA